MLTTKKISIVIACYKDEKNISEMYRRLSKLLPKITSDYEIIFVNDGSPDDSEQILSEISVKDQKVTAIIQARNFGAQNAFTAGMEQSLGEAVVIMDGDLQDPPEMIEGFVKKWLEGFEVVYGIRRKREASMGKINEWLYHIFYLILNKLAYVEVPTDAGEFSLMDRRVVDIINSMPERDRLLRGLRAWIGFHQCGIPYVRPERFSGKSTNSLLANTKWARKAIFSFSYAPLELVSRGAFFVMLVALAAIIYYFIAFFFIGAPQGFLTTLIVILFLGSIQLLSLAIIGEYLGRIFEEIKQRPKYVTRKIINNHRTEKSIRQ